MEKHNKLPKAWHCGNLCVSLSLPQHSQSQNTLIRAQLMQKCPSLRSLHCESQYHAHTCMAHLQHLSNISARVCVTSFTQSHYKQLFPALTATLTTPNSAQLRHKAQKCGWHILTQWPLKVNMNSEVTQFILWCVIHQRTLFQKKFKMQYLPVESLLLFSVDFI